ncbi:MAG: hypothetical protein R3A46_20165 [Thermomicrobiales bacterium]
MPDLRDFSALPTSWALTLWDALPVFLSIELAVAILVVLATEPSARRRLWDLTSGFPIGGMVFAALFDRNLTVILGVAIIANIALMRYFPYHVESTAPPSSPRQALASRLPDVGWSVAKAAFAAAVIKTLVIPTVEAGSMAWLVVAVIGGSVTPAPIGAAAIPALAIESASDSLVPATLWLCAALARPYISDKLSSSGLAGRRSSDATKLPENR